VTPLTLEEHFALGAELHQMRNRLTTLAVEIGPRCDDGRIDRAIDAVQRRLDQLRSLLSRRLGAEHPGARDAYYQT